MTDKQCIALMAAIIFSSGRYDDDPNSQPLDDSLDAAALIFKLAKVDETDG